MDTGAGCVTVDWPGGLSVDVCLRTVVRCTSWWTSIFGWGGFSLRGAWTRVLIWSRPSVDRPTVAMCPLVCRLSFDLRPLSAIDGVYVFAWYACFMRRVVAW